MISIRPGCPEDAASLTELCLRSKAVWDYDDAFMAACEAELRVTAEIMMASLVIVAELDGHITDMAQLDVRGTVADLEKMFIDPGWLRIGVGRALFDQVLESARQLGATVLFIDADPGAAGFYRRLGAVDAGTAASGSIPGRSIPRLRFEL